MDYTVIVYLYPEGFQALPGWKERGGGGSLEKDQKCIFSRKLYSLKEIYNYKSSLRWKLVAMYENIGVFLLHKNKNYNKMQVKYMDDIERVSVYGIQK